MSKILLLLTILTLNLFAISLDKVPNNITIEGDNGGYAEDGSSWNSSTIKDKVYVMFYVDPDERTTNEHFSQMLKAKKYDKRNSGSIAIINMAATWKPNIIIEKLLKSKQKEFPDTIYIKDKKSVLVNNWGLDDDASNILIFSKDSKLLFYKSGKMSNKDMKKAFKLIEENL